MGAALEYHQETTRCAQAPLRRRPTGARSAGCAACVCTESRCCVARCVVLRRGRKTAHCRHRPNAPVETPCCIVNGHCHTRARSGAPRCLLFLITQNSRLEPALPDNAGAPVVATADHCLRPLQAQRKQSGAKPALECGPPLPLCCSQPLRLRPWASSSTWRPARQRCAPAVLAASRPGGSRLRSSKHPHIPCCASEADGGAWLQGRLQGVGQGRG